MKDSWQCQVCGVVYAWWVSRCKETHPVVTDRSKKVAAQAHMAIDKKLGEETPEWIRKIAESES